MLHVTKFVLPDGALTQGMLAGLTPIGASAGATQVRSLLRNYYPAALDAFLGK